MEINVNFKENVDLGKLFSGVAKKALLAITGASIVVGSMNIGANTDKPAENPDAACVVTETVTGDLQQHYNFKSGLTYITQKSGASAPSVKTIDEVVKASPTVKKHVEQLKLQVPGRCLPQTRGA